jgi:hypothetical protein
MSVVRTASGNWSGGFSSKIRSDALGPVGVAVLESDGTERLPTRAIAAEEFLIARFAIRAIKCQPTQSICDSYVPDNRRRRVRPADLSQLQREVKGAIDTVFNQLNHRADFDVEVSVTLEPPARRPWLSEFAT